MLTKKVDYVLGDIAPLRKYIIERYSKNLDIYGSQEATLGIFIDIFNYCLSLQDLGHTLKLELYKRYSNLLREAGLAYFIPNEPIPKPIPTMPYYYGSNSANLNPLILQTVLSQDISPKSDKTYYYTAIEQVFIIAYPKEHGPLVRITDQNGYNVTNGWSIREVNFILESQFVQYYVYETKNIVTLTNFSNTFTY